MAQVMEGVLTEATSDVESDPLGTLQSWEAPTSDAMAQWAYNLGK